METLLGFVIAVLVGLTGVGGGSVTVPVLILALNIPAAQAVGTALVFVTVTKMIAAPVYVFRRQVDTRALKLLLLGGIPGVLAGSLILSSTRSRAMEPYVLAAVGGVIAMMAALSLCRYLWKNQRRKPSNREHRLPWAALPIGIETGFSSAGAGALGSLALMCLTPLETAKIVGTDLLFGLAVSAIGGGLHAVSGNIDRVLLLKLCAGAIPGAAFGALLGDWIPSRPLRAALTLFLALLGGQLFWKGLSSFVR